MKYAAIYIPEFPVVSWMRMQPEVRASAAVLLKGAAPLEHVFSRSHAAAQLGITHGMSKVQAETTGEVRFHKRYLAGEQEAFAEVIKIVEGFSPRVEAITSPDNDYGDSESPAVCVLLDRSGTDKLIGTAQQFTRRLAKSLNAARFDANVAAADNAEACILLAENYAGVTCAGKNEIHQILSRLPVSTLKTDDTTLSIFQKWGIGTLGQLAALPEAALISRIGQHGKRLQQLACGVADHLLVAEEPRFSLAAKVELDTPVELLESLLFIISPMLEQLIRSAMERACALRHIAIELILDSSARHSCTVQPALPSSNRDLLLKLINLQLQAHPPAAAILGVILTAEPARPQTAQRGLFQTQFPDPDKLDLLIARLRSIAGQDAVGSPALNNSYCPDDYDLKTYKPGVLPEVETHTASRLALRYMRPPQQVKVSVTDGTPCALYWEGIQMPIAKAMGPWQTSGYWWEARRWTMDEWDAVIAQPYKALRLRHEHASNSWSIAGMYD